MCHVLQVSRSGYYDWSKRPESNRSRSNRELLHKIREVYDHSKGVYGSPRITAALRHKGICCSKGRVARLMQENGIASRMKRKFKATTNSKHSFPVAPNLLNQNFEVSEKNRVWVSDITYIPTGEGWLYLAAVMDLFDRKVVGWSMDTSMKTELCMTALDLAVGRENPGEGLIHHSDRGVQYASHEFRQALLEKHFVQSMSRKGNCYDNACMESFIGSIKTELIYLTRFKTREQARTAIFEYIEIFYNRKRLHSKLGYMSPAEFEKHHAA